MSKPAAPAWKDSAWRDPARVSFSRSLVVLAIGAVIGLGLAGVSLFTSKGSSSLIVPADAVALVNQQPISRIDYLAQLQTLYGVDLAQATPGQKRQALDDMIAEELYVQRGVELDMAAVDPDVRAAMVSAVQQSVAADALSREPAETALRAYYGANHERYADQGVMTVRDLIFPEKTAPAAAQALKAGDPAAVLVRYGGRDSGATSGEEFYFAARIHLGDTLFAAARVLPDGGVSAPIAAKGEAHVLYMLRNQAPVAQPYEEARAQVRGDYTRSEIKRLQDRDAKFLRKRANVLIAADFKDDMR